MITSEAKKLIEENPVAIATCTFDIPDVAAVADVKVVDEDKLLIGDNFLTTTRANILKNGKVALVVWNKDWEKDCFGYKIIGKAEYLEVGEYYEKVKEIHAGFPAKGAILVTVNEIKRIGD
jgi:predicted pyridoxine 5'-phosphate oxidase superfamily flavin-nucleotide-binding protein